MKLSPKHWSITGFACINRSIVIPPNQQSHPCMQHSSFPPRPPAPRYASQAHQAPSVALKSAGVKNGSCSFNIRLQNKHLY